MQLGFLRVLHVVLSVLAPMMSAAALSVPEEDGGERGERGAQGDVPYMPSFLSTPTNVSFLAGEEAVLQCAIENRGARIVSWRRASDPNPLTIGEDTFVKDRRIYVQHQQHSLEWNLHIKHATPEDSGVYECHVVTKSRDLRQMILLHVEDTPFSPTYKSDIQISGSQFVEKGNTLSLTCNATGFDYPPDELDWFKDGNKLVSGQRLRITKDVSLADKTIVSKLEISRAAMIDAGTYICRASNLQVTSAKVNVLNTDTVNEKRESRNQSTVSSYGPYSAASKCSSAFLLLVLSLTYYLMTT